MKFINEHTYENYIKINQAKTCYIKNLIMRFNLYKRDWKI
jgi:hypothetical protein